MINYLNKLKLYGGYFDVDSKKSRLKKLEEESLDSEFWNDNKKATEILKEIGDLKKIISEIDNIKSSLISNKDLLNLNDSSINEEIEKEINQISKKIEHLELTAKLSDKNDKDNAILELHSGAGGTESCDWAEMLLRMYLRWCEKNNYSYEVLDTLEGEEAGIKKAIVLVKGLNAYGYLKCERGVHRLIRLSPFDSSNRRHTSFAAVEVTPDIEEDINIEIKDSDIRIDVYRSTGAGGQGVNTTDSAVRITHLPTNTVVTCQNERSQLKNKEIAMKILKSKLYALEEQKRLEESAEYKSSQSDINFGSQIRSYIMHPYSMVKDHRTNYETSNVTKVLDGDINDFIESYLRR